MGLLLQKGAGLVRAQNGFGPCVGSISRDASTGLTTVRRRSGNVHECYDFGDDWHPQHHRVHQVPTKGKGWRSHSGETLLPDLRVPPLGRPQAHIFQDGNTLYSSESER